MFASARLSLQELKPINHRRLGFIERYVLPEAQHAPSFRLEPGVRIDISRSVRGDLLRPPFPIGLWNGGMDRTPMPKATVAEHSQALRCEGDVNGPFGAFDTSIMNPEPETSTVQGRAQCSLAGVVSAFRQRHSTAGVFG